MRYGLDVPTTGEFADARALADLAAEAEAAGWDGFFVWDVLDGLDAWVALTAVALRTERLRVGTMVLALPRHRPWLVARRLADLDRLSGGRVTCAVGLGYQEKDFAAYGLPADPATRAELLDEGLQVLDGLLSNERFSFGGRHYRLEDVALGARPLQPRIPLWAAGGWPRRAPFRRAARWDGASFMSVHAETRAWLSLEEFRAGVAYLREQRAGGGPLEIAMSGDSSGDRAEAAAKVRAFAEAGATWWVEEGIGWTLGEFREHVRAGPPRGESGSSEAQNG